MNLKEKQTELTINHSEIYSKLHETTTIFSRCIAHIADHPYLYGIGIVTIFVIYNWSNIWSYITKGPDDEFGVKLKETIATVGEGFEAANKQLDCLSHVQAEVIGLTKVVNNFAKASGEQLNNVASDMTQINAVLSEIIVKINGLEQTVITNKIVMSSLLAAQECATALL